MKNSPNIHNINLHELAQAIEEEKSRNPESAGISEKELISNILERYRREIAEERGTDKSTKQEPLITQQTATSATMSDEGGAKEEEYLPDYASKSPEEAKREVEELIELTFQKGLRAGLKEAHNRDPYVLDMFHDALTDKLILVLRENNLL